MGCCGDAANISIYSLSIHFMFILAIAVVPFGSLRAAKIDVGMSTAILLKVDQSGDGDFVKIQDAIDAVPSNNKQVYFILVKPGTFR